VLELRHYLTLQAIKKLKVDVVDQMEGLLSDSYHCQTSLDEYIREYESGCESLPSGVSVSIVLEFDRVATPRSP
jgi:hypothetical protein